MAHEVNAFDHRRYTALEQHIIITRSGCWSLWGYAHRPVVMAATHASAVRGRAVQNTSRTQAVNGKERVMVARVHRPGINKERQEAGHNDPLRCFQIPAPVDGALSRQNLSGEKVKMG